MSKSSTTTLEGILIVDDSPVITHALSGLLSSHGFKVVGIAVNGIEALKKVHAYHPAIVLMDLNLPVLDGYNAIMAVKAINADIKIIAISAESDKVNIMKAIKAGADDYLVKPVRAENLFRVIDRIVSG